MSRKPRALSKLNIYHVMFRGVNRKRIFYDTEDYDCFLKLLAKYKDISHFRLHAYCIMGNHVHLLIEITLEGQELSTVVQRILTAFVCWYKEKYEYIGHLFQGRFRSEPVQDDRYYMTVLRYIVRNPVKAGICEEAEQYKYSSARDYCCPGSGSGLTDMERALTLMGRDEWRAFIASHNEDECMDMDTFENRNLCDEEARELICMEFGTCSPTPGSPRDREDFYRSVQRLKQKGISIRQLSRLTGVSKKIIERSLKK